MANRESSDVYIALPMAPSSVQKRIHFKNNKCECYLTYCHILWSFFLSNKEELHKTATFFIISSLVYKHGSKNSKHANKKDFVQGHTVT